MEILPEEPRIGEKGEEAGQGKASIGKDLVAHRMLHEGVRGHDEESRGPSPQEDQEGREPVGPGRKPLPAEEEEGQEGRLQEEGENAFHGQGLADYTARSLRESGPVRAELELHGDSGDDPHGEVDPEYLPPEVRSPVESLIPAPERPGLQDEDEQTQAHCELGEEVVVGDGEGEVKPVVEEGDVHCFFRCGCGSATKVRR